MCASEDGARLMAEHTNETQFFAMNAFENSDKPWFKGTYEMLFNKHVKTMVSSPKGYRSDLGVGDSTFPKLTYYPVNYVLDKELTVYDPATLVNNGNYAQFATAAQTAQKLVYDSSKDNFTSGIWKLP